MKVENIPKVLVIDDDPTYTSKLKFDFERVFDIRVAEKICSVKHLVVSDRPDIIILDVDIEGREGYFCLEKLQENMVAPVIVLSKHSESEYEKQGTVLRMGAVDFHSKPYKHEIIHTLIKRYTAISKQFLQFGGSFSDFAKCRTQHRFERPPVVMLIDDCTRFSNQFCHLMSDLFDIRWYRDIDEARDDLFKGVLVPDLILLDRLWGPSASGDVLLRQLKSDRVLNDIPVVMLSNSWGAHIISNCLLLADDYIFKKIDKTNISERLSLRVHLSTYLRRLKSSAVGVEVA